MSADAFAEIDAWMKSLLAATAPAARKRLLRELARELRKRNQARMARQTGPDGAKWEPRKRNSRGKVRDTAKMMVGLRAARRLRIGVTADGAEIGWRGRTARIAAVHHFGGVDAVAEDGPRTRYPARELLGISAADRSKIRNSLSNIVDW